MQHSPLQLRQKLIDTVDGNYHVKDMDAIVEILGILERLPVTKDMLESTRLGKTVNEFRRRVNNDYLAKRAKALVKKWRETILLPEDSSQSSQPVLLQQPVLPPQPPPKAHNGSAGNSVDALLREQIAQAQREGHGRTTDEIVKDLEKKSVEQKWEAAAKSSTSGNSKRRKTGAVTTVSGESKSSRKSKSAVSSVEVSQDSDIGKKENDIVETYLRSQNELRLQMERQYQDSLTNDNANSHGAGSFNDADENDNENHPSLLLNQSKFSKRYSPKKTKKLKSTSIETASSSSSSAISPTAFEFAKTQPKQPSVSPTLPTYSRHETSSEDSHISASKQEPSNRRKRKLSSPNVVSPVEEEDEDESFEEVEPYFSLDSNPRKNEDVKLVVEFSSSSRQFNDVTEDRLSSSSSSSNSSNSSSIKNNIRASSLNYNGSVSSTLASLEYGQSNYSPTTKSNFSQFRNEQKLSPTIGSSHWNSHHTSPSLSTSATSSATKRKKSKKKRDKSTELNNHMDASSDSHSVVVPEGGSGLTTFDLIQDEDEQHGNGQVLEARASSISLDNNKQTFLFDEESRMDVVSPSGSEIHGAAFSLEDPKFSYRGLSLQDTDDYNDTLDIRREIDVESLHTQQIPNVNGNLDTEGTVRMEDYLSVRKNSPNKATNMDSENCNDQIHHRMLEIADSGGDKEDATFLIFPSDGTAAQDFVGHYAESDNQNGTQLGTASHLVSSQSVNRSDLDLKSIPDKILATEEDLGYDESEMVIADDPQPKRRREDHADHDGVDEVHPIIQANIPTQLGMNKQGGIPDGTVCSNATKATECSDLLNKNDSVDTTENMQPCIQLEEDINVHNDGRDHSVVSEVSGLERVEALNNPDADSSEVEPRIRLPFSFPGQSFNEQAQKLILNVWDFFKRVKKNPRLLENLRGPQDHAAAALNVGTKTIGKIAKRVLRLGKLETPGKKRNRPKTVLDSVGAEGEDTIRSIIRDMYERRVAPTVPLVLAEVKAKLNFKGSTTSLRRILKRMGYKYGGIDNSLIQSDKVFVSGWKEKSSKKKFRNPQLKKKLGKTKEKQHPVVEVLPSSSHVVPQIVEPDGIIASHEISDMMQPHEVIIHYRKPEDAFLPETAHNQIITVTTDQTDIIQLQLDANGDPVNVVQEWHWQPCPQDSSSLGLKSL